MQGICLFLNFIGKKSGFPEVDVMVNTSEDGHFATDESVENSSLDFLSSPLLLQPPSLPIASIIVGLVTGVTGTFENAVVVVVLLYARRHFGSNVNTLITNQSAMDLFACIFLTISCGMSFPGAKQKYLELGEVANNLVCFLFRNRVLAIVGMNAEKFGLA